MKPKRPTFMPWLRLAIRNKFFSAHKKSFIHTKLLDEEYYCLSVIPINTKSPELLLVRDFSSSKEAATYSPALHCSTIGAGGLNFSVRNGKRWDPAAITTEYSLHE